MVEKTIATIATDRGEAKSPRGKACQTEGSACSVRVRGDDRCGRRARRREDGAPDTTPCPEPIVDIATCYVAEHETGAYITAALPKTWNGNLVVFADGGLSLLPPTAVGSKADPNKNSYAVQRGFASVHEGYGVAMVAADSDNARKFFIPRIGEPQHTILHGASYGGPVGADPAAAALVKADGCPRVLPVPVVSIGKSPET